MADQKYVDMAMAIWDERWSKDTPPTRREMMALLADAIALSARADAVAACMQQIIVRPENAAAQHWNDAIGACIAAIKARP